MNAPYVRKDISLMIPIIAQVKLFKSILECPVEGCAECDPNNNTNDNTCYYCMYGAKLIYEPSGTPKQKCKSN